MLPIYILLSLLISAKFRNQRNDYQLHMLAINWYSASLHWYTSFKQQRHRGNLAKINFTRQQINDKHATPFIRTFPLSQHSLVTKCSDKQNFTVCLPLKVPIQWSTYQLSLRSIKDISRYANERRVLQSKMITLKTKALRTMLPNQFDEVMFFGFLHWRPQMWQLLGVPQM